MRTTSPRPRSLRPRTTGAVRRAAMSATPCSFERVETRLMFAAGTFTGAYFNNADLTNPVLTRADANINFNWGTGSPDPAVGASTFSVRWTGQIKPTATGTYTFHTTADDGVRLFVGSGATPLINRWTDRTGLQGDANNDGAVNFTDFQILERQLRTTGPESDFNNDGTVDNADFKILYANFGQTGSSTVPVNSATITLQAGQTYNLTLEYYQNAKDSQAKLEWEGPGLARQLVTPAEVTNPGGPGGYTPGTGSGLYGSYYDNLDFTGTRVSRIDPSIDFHWNGQRPTSRIDTTTFSVRWEGQVQGTLTGEYTFYTRTDDGVRLWVNNEQIADYWFNQDAIDPYPSFPIFLQAGQRYDIRLEYYQDEGTAGAELMWLTPGNATPVLVPTAQLYPSTGSVVDPPPPPPVMPTGTLRVSSDGHFIQKTDGTPFFWLADTAWSLFNKSSRAEVDTYLQTRADQEFTVTQAVLFNPDTRVRNYYGDNIFVNGNPATPNDAYFQHVDYVLSQANDNGLYVAVLPTWGDAVSATDSRKVFNTANAYTYGQWLGERYAQQPNIVWVLGGDWPANTPESQAIWRAMAQGLRDGDGGTHLITYHPQGGATSSTWFQNDSWLAYNTIQSGHGIDTPNYNTILSDYNKGKPVIDAEPNYEDIPSNLQMGNPPITDYDVRKKTYWALFAGAFGAAYGHVSVYQFYTGSTFDHWQVALDDPGANQMKFARRLMQSRPYLGRVPDQSIVTTATLSGTNHIQATRAGDGSYAFVYSASGQAFTVDLTKISGSTARTWWYNPRTGESSNAGNHATTGSQSFTPPTSGTGNDWVLVLDDAAKNYAAPGTTVIANDPNGDVVTGSATIGSESIPYRLFTPTGVPAGQKVPLILHLHGKGNRGTDNQLQTQFMGGIIANTHSGQYAAYTLAPQIDTDMWFQSYTDQPTIAMQLTLKAVQQVMSQYNIDPSRVYVTGLSMGGMGTFDALRWAPDLFAAAIPMSGGAHPDTAAAIKHVPIWAFHGDADDVVPVSETRQIIQALRDQGASPKYTEIPGAKHVIWDPIYYDNSHTLYAWLFAQQKPQPAAPVTVDPVTVPVTPTPAPPRSRPAPKPVFSATRVNAQAVVATAAKNEDETASLFDTAPAAPAAPTNARAVTRPAKR